MEAFKSYLLLLILLLGAVCNPALADDAKPRYVSGDGSDSGLCTNAFRPCRSLAYAVLKAGKFDPVLIAAGEYQVADLDHLVMLLSSNLKAGLDRISGYTTQDRERFVSTLSGVPLEYRNYFEARGFKVIVDTKGAAIAKSKLQHFQQKLSVTASNQTQTPCVSGRAGSYPCSNIDLLNHTNLASLGGGAASDIWGFVDLNTQREYVIIGLDRGAAVVDVTDPAAPEVIGTHSGRSSTWRDVKILQTWDTGAARWRAYAYVSTEASMGLTILDLSNLPNGFSEIRDTSDILTAHNVYLINADYAMGVPLNNSEPLLTVAGSNKRSGSYRLLSLQNPSAPQLLEYSSAGYMHDAASIKIRDSRQTSQCANAAAAESCWLLADFNEDTIDIWDLTQPQSPVRLSQTSYAGASYVHSGWWSEDGMLLFVQDELDEAYNGQNTAVRIFNMANLTQPQLLSTWRSDNRAIDHNGFVRGNRYYMSHYLEGLTVIDFSNPAAPQTSAYFDTFPASSATAFDGAWGVYPFLPSGTLAISDISGGLYLVKEADTPNANGKFAFALNRLAGVEGDTVQVTVERQGGSLGAAQVAVEVQYLTANSADLTSNTETLSWSNGDSEPKNISLTLLEDGSDEGIEMLAVRLVKPSGARTTQPDIAFVAISDVAAVSELAPLTSEISTTRSRVMVPIKRKGSSQGDVSVSWQLSDSAAASPASGQIAWSDGDTSTKTLALNLAADTTAFELQLSDAENAEVQNSTVAITRSAATPSPSPVVTPTLEPGTAGVTGGSGSGGGAIGWLALFLASVSVLRGFRRKS